MNSKTKWFRLLKWFSPDHLYEEIEGDLLQKFEKDVKSFGDREAKKDWVGTSFDFSGQVLC